MSGTDAPPAIAPSAIVSPPSGAEWSLKLCAPAGGCQAITPRLSQCAPGVAASGRGTSSPMTWVAWS